MSCENKNDHYSAALSAQDIEKYLSKEIYVRVFDKIDSTNNEAKRLLENGFRGKALIVSEAQTSGRGRLGRTFYSPEKTGLYFTVIIPGNMGFANAALLTPAAAVSVARVIKRESKKNVKIKWVNDIYFEDKKICGILAEAVTDSSLNDLAGIAVGIGINLSTVDFPKEIESVASSLDIKNADRNFIAASIAKELFSFAENISERAFIPEYREMSYVTGKDIFVIKGEQRYEARAVGIDNDGGLITELSDGSTMILRGGEISVRVKDISR